MDSVNIVTWFGQLKESDPMLFARLFGFAIGFGGALLVCMVIYWNDFFISKKNEKTKRALDLIGKSVTYKNEPCVFYGEVVSVSFDLGENGSIEATIFVDVPGFDKIISVNYREFNKRLFVKGE